jgi:hypothetical protein
VEVIGDNMIFVMIGLSWLIQLILSLISHKGIRYFYELYNDESDKNKLMFIVWFCFIISSLIHGTLLYFKMFNLL